MTPQQEIQILKTQLKLLEDRFNMFARPDRYTINRPLGLFNKTPIPQWTSGIGRGDVTSDTGVAAKRSTQYDGNLGGTGYSIGDLVAFFKTRGDIAP